PHRGARTTPRSRCRARHPTGLGRGTRRTAPGASPSPSSGHAGRIADRSLPWPTPDSAGEVWPDLGAEALDLVAQLVDRARLEAHLQVGHAHRAVFVHRIGELLRRPGDRAPRHLPIGLAHVHRLGDDADFRLGAGPGAITMRPEVVDRVRHLLARRPLGNPSVAALGHAPQRRAARAADPDRRAGVVEPAGPPGPPPGPPPRGPGGPGPPSAPPGPARAPAPSPA